VPDRTLSIPSAAQPKPAACAFDLEAALSSVVALRAEIPEDAFTAPILGTERAGHGIVIGAKGLVLTIGYLITEAQTIWLVSNAGTAVPADVVGFDQATGFGLIQALGRLNVPPIELGSARAAQVGQQVIVAGHGGLKHALCAEVVARREFAGYWEYLLDEAIFTAPPHPSWGGAACIGPDGRLLGVGSLFVQETTDGEPVEGNMIVPIDLLLPVLDDLQRLGRASTPARPWLGMYTADTGADAVVVIGLAPRGPAQDADIRAGDVVLRVAGAPFADLGGMFRKVWALGPAGVEVPLTVMRDGKLMEIRLRSADRNDFLKRAAMH
jgi:S1-C subfamily serine protease